MSDSEFADMPEADDDVVETAEAYEPMGTMPEPEEEDALRYIPITLFARAVIHEFGW